MINKFIKSFSLVFTIGLCLCSKSVYAFIEAEEFTTKTGAKVILVADKTTDMVAVNMAFKGAGSAFDPISKKGLSYLTMQMLQRGTIGGLDRHQRSRKLRDLGILSEIQLNISPDNLYVSFKAPLEYIGSALTEVYKILSFRDFDTKDLNNLKSYIPSGSQINTADEVAFAHKTVLNLIFPNHPYGTPVNGNYNDIQTITKKDLITFLDSAIAKDNLYISIVGDINKYKLTKHIDTTFKNLPKKAKLPLILKPSIQFDNNIDSIFKDSPQSGVVFVQQGLEFHNKDFYAFAALLDILIAEPFTSRLWQEVRERRGLVYDIGAKLNTEFDHAGLTVGWFKCDNDKVSDIISTIRKEWQNIKKNGIKKQEFTDTITNLIGSYALNFTTPASISSYLLFLKLKGLDPSFIKTRNDIIKSLTIKDINAVAKKYLTPEQLKFVVVGSNAG